MLFFVLCSHCIIVLYNLFHCLVELSCIDYDLSCISVSVLAEVLIPNRPLTTWHVVNTGHHNLPSCSFNCFMTPTEAIEFRDALETYPHGATPGILQNTNFVANFVKHYKY